MNDKRLPDKPLKKAPTLGQLVIISLCFFAILPAGAAPKEEELCDVMIFDQLCGKLGATKLIIAKEGCKFVGRDGKLVAVSKAPDWRLMFYNEPRRLAYACNFDEMQKKSSGLFAGPPYDQGKCNNSQEPRFALHTQTLSVTGGAMKEGRSDTIFFQVRKKQQFASVKHVMADKVVLDPHAQIFIRWIYGTAYHPGVPLQYENIFTDGTIENVYKTVAVTKNKLPISTFAYPSGFKTATKTLDVVMLDDPREALEDMFGDRK